MTKKTHKKDFQPSRMMRRNRPEYYSDSTSTQAYQLSRPVFSHHLTTLTERNQHTPFETFCRALAQREICPNLRPQTGPEGGGDGKVDTETYPVADEISERWYEGFANSGKERWAFAFSAKKRWSEKVRSDVKGIVKTGREYSRIHFFTNQNPRAADRLRIEQELTKQYKIPVTIYDRNWIEEKTINNHHEDLAHDILGVGEFDANKIVKGPQDTRREAELTEIEAAFSQLDKSRMTNIDRVSEALRAAKLSRGMECPRNETDGRFTRAIRLAKKYGTERQHLIAIYEHAWTCIWWFDDINTASELYDEIEPLALASQATTDLEKLSNLLHVFVGWARQSEVDSTSLRLKERGSTLVSKLETIASDTSSPNNALYAESLLTLHSLIELVQDEESNELDRVWKRFINIIDRAQGLTEFPAELIDKLIATLSQFAPDSETFDELVMKLADFMGDRKKDGKQGEIFFTRGSQKLDAGKPADAVVWLGKATVAFSKKEYQESQVETVCKLAIAYYRAGLFWSARATALSCLVTLSTISDEEGRIQERLLPAVKIYIFTCLQLGHLSDLLEGIFLLHLCLSHMSLSEEREQQLEREYLELDHLLSCSMVALNESELCKLSALPSVLDHFQLFTARMVLLYRLGYQSELRSDGSLPNDMTDHEIIELLQQILSQPATKDLPRSVILNDRNPFEITTKVLGVQIHFRCEPKISQILVCELLVSSLEGFTATMLNRGVHPCTPHANVLLTAGGEKIDIQIDKHTFTVKVLWPEEIGTGDHTQSKAVQEAVIKFVANTMGLITLSKDINSLLEELVHHEKVLDRCILFSNTGISRSRIFESPISKLSDLPAPSKKSYPLKDNAPTIETGIQTPESEQHEKPNFTIQRHTDMSVHTIINPHLWDDAEWNGTAYFVLDPDYPPVLGLLFRNPKAGSKIFEQLREQFGPVDEDELIRVAILKGINRAKPLHYRVHITASRAAYEKQFHAHNPVMLLSRFHLMKAETHENMAILMNHYKRHRAYYFAPVEQTVNGPRPRLDLSLIKRQIYVTDAWKVDQQHADAPAILPSDDVVIPKSITDPPIYELLDVIKRRSKP